MSQTHLVGISSDSKSNDRLKLISEEFQFNSAFFKNCDELNDQFEAQAAEVRVAVLCVANIQDGAEIAGQLQVLKFSCPEAYTILVISKKIPAESIAFIKKSGADLIIDETDFFETSFLEFILSQRIRGSLIPMKYQDFVVDSTVNFKVMTMLPLAQKLLPVIFPGEQVKPKKVERLKSAKELYVLRDDADQLQEYLKNNKDMTADGIVARCRVNYMNLCVSHANFILTLFDKSEAATFSSGKALLDKCTALANEMLMTLSTLTNPWSVINNSTIGETGSAERSPAISAMAGLLAMSLDGIKTEDTLVAGLLADIGMLCLPPNLLKKVRQNKSGELTKEEKTKYEQHPTYSINKCLAKKIPLSDAVKHIIMCTHEKFDNSGFPGKINPDYIVKESQLLQYCEVIDQKLLIKMGSKSQTSNELQNEILKEELSSKKILELSLCSELKKLLDESAKMEKAS